ncbi:hypothetical protein, partial [Brevibacterium sp. NPDC056947]|uniref:hypothetical protein n=1 Tax=Brevibacterium sp. NPDC056947 TaxID=3345974 RepID=UPI0036270266
EPHRTGVEGRDRRGEDRRGGRIDEHHPGDDFLWQIRNTSSPSFIAVGCKNGENKAPVTAAALHPSTRKPS